MASGVTNYMRNVRPNPPEHITTHKGLNRAERRALRKSGEFNLQTLQYDMKKQFQKMKEASE